MPTLNRPKRYTQIKSLTTARRRKVYATKEWKNLRLAYIMQHPKCEICEKRGRLRLAEDVHHKDSFTNYEGETAKNKAFDWSNLIALCKQCHSFLHKNGTTHGLNLEEIVQKMADYERKNMF